jgi:hypothetical protein
MTPRTRTRLLFRRLHRRVLTGERCECCGGARTAIVHVGRGVRVRGMLGSGGNGGAGCPLIVDGVRVSSIGRCEYGSNDY